MSEIYPDEQVIAQAYSRSSDVCCTIYENDDGFRIEWTRQEHDYEPVPGGTEIVHVSRRGQAFNVFVEWLSKAF